MVGVNPHATPLAQAALPATTLVVNPHCGPYYNGGKMHLSFTTDDGGTNFSLMDYDRWFHRDVESTQGNFNFQPILDKITLARSRGREYALCFRWLRRGDVSGEGSRVPDYLTSTSYGWFLSTDTTANKTFIPDWNNETWLQRAEALIAAAGAALDGKLAAIDMGGWGQYGEWAATDIATSDPNYVNGGFKLPSLAIENRIRDWYPKYFPKTLKTMHMAATTSLGAGLLERSDIGRHPQIIGEMDGTANQMFGSGSINKYMRYKHFRNYKNALCMGESIGPTHDFTNKGQTLNDAGLIAQMQARLFNISTLRGENWDFNNSSLQAREDWAVAYRKMGYRYQLERLDIPAIEQNKAQTWTMFWRNNGTAVTHVPYKLRFELRATATSAPVWTGVSTLDFKQVTPTGLLPKVVMEPVTVSGVATGTYRVHIKALDANGFWRPLHFDQGGLQADQSYYMGDVAVTAAAVGNTVSGIAQLGVISASGSASTSRTVKGLAQFGVITASGTATRGPLPDGVITVNEGPVVAPEIVYITPTRTLEGLMWPRIRYTVADVCKDVRLHLTDTFGLVVSDDEITQAINEALAQSYPNYGEIYRYRYQWPNVAGTVQLPTTVALPPEPGTIIGVAWEHPYGRALLYEYSDNSDKLVLPHVVPRSDGALIVDLMHAPRINAGTVSVSRRYLSLVASALLVTTWQRRTKEDRTFERTEWLQLAALEAMRSGGGPGVDAEGRYL